MNAAVLFCALVLAGNLWICVEWSIANLRAFTEGGDGDQECGKCENCRYCSDYRVIKSLLIHLFVYAADIFLAIMFLLKVSN